MLARALKTAGDKQNNNDQCATLRASRVQQAATVCDNENVNVVLCQSNGVLSKFVKIGSSRVEPCEPSLGMWRAINYGPSVGVGGLHFRHRRRSLLFLCGDRSRDTSS